jgi:dipeptidyl aminopeptidase/acylaminoacyl peptidase
MPLPFPTRVSLASITALALSVPTPASAQGRRVELNDLGHEIGLASPRLSPDGNWVALVLRRTNYEENRFERTVVLVDAHTGTHRDLTPGRANAFAPEWSPSGDRLAFLASDTDTPVQLWVMPTGGGEARQVTTVKTGVQGYTWHPDGQMFAIRLADEREERTGEERHNKSFEVGDNVYLAQEAPMSVHVHTVSVDGGDLMRHSSGTKSVNSMEWAAGGRELILLTQPRPHTGESRRTQLEMVDVETGEERLLVPGPTVINGFDLSPDGRYVSWGHYRGREPYFHPADLSVLPVSGGESRLLTESIDRNVGNADWLPSGDALLVSGFDGTRVGVWVVPMDGDATRLDLGTIDPVSGFEIHDGGSMVFLGREAHRPTELYHMRSSDAAPRRLTDFNAELASRDLGRVETITWDGPDGFEENGVLIYPPDFDDGRTYPLVLSIHGGPMSTSTEGWSTFGQLLAAQDWVVFSPNYRGSSNMGDAYQSAVIDDAGEGPGRDVMAGIEAVTARGFVDDTRIATSGWSYGGYMTAWLTAHYQIWRAAVAGAAVTDWFDWYNLADMNVWAGFGLGGSPWLNDNAENYWRQSPMAYAHQIRTPTLILSTTGDPRVTVTQSYKLYHALKDNGVTVKFIAYPTGGHFPPDPVHQRDVRRRWIEWITLQFERGQTSEGGR